MTEIEQSTQEEASINEHSLLMHARQAIRSHQYGYAMFLFREALKKKPDDLESRKEMHELRHLFKQKIGWWERWTLFSLRCQVLLQNSRGKYDAVIILCEKILDINNASAFAVRLLLQAALIQRYDALAIYIYESNLDVVFEMSTLVEVVYAYIRSQDYPKAMLLGKELSQMYPDDESVKDALLKASVERHNHSDITLMTAGGENRFVPPKIETDKIVLQTHKENKSETGSKVTTQAGSFKM